MSLQSLTSIHEVTVKRESDTRGRAGGQGLTYTTVATGVKCRVRPVTLVNSEQFGVAGQDITHQVMFSTNPNLDERNILIFNGRTLYVKTVRNSGELNRLWTAWCVEGAEGVE